MAGRRLAEVDVGDRERIGVGEGGGLDIGADAGPVELADVVPVVSLSEAEMTVQVTPAAAALGDVPHQPLDLADGGGDLVDGRAREAVLRVSGHPAEQVWERGVDDGGEMLESLADGPTMGSVEPEPVVSEIRAGLPSGLVHRERGFADVEVVDVGLAERISVGEFVGDGSAVDRRQADQQIFPGPAEVVVLRVGSPRRAGGDEWGGAVPDVLELGEVSGCPVHRDQQLVHLHGGSLP